MRYLLYLPGLILLLAPLLVATLKDHAAAQERRELEAKIAAAEEEKRIAAEAKKAEQERKAAEREAIRAAKDAEKQRRMDARLEYARQMAELAERKAKALREAKELERSTNISPATKPKLEPKPQPKPEPQVKAPATPAKASNAARMINFILLFMLISFRTAFSPGRPRSPLSSRRHA